MIELPLVFVAGALGTAHCFGMCGPFALAIGSGARNWPAALVRQAAYTAGRVFTYGTLGAAAGLCGQRLVTNWPNVVSVPALVAIAAGVFLVFQGLVAAGLIRKRGVGPAAAPCLAGGFLGHFLRQPTAGTAFFAGLFTGLLPCGLLYGMLALAMSTQSTVGGGLTMVVFGLGTAPAMIGVGLAGRIVAVAARRWLFAAAAWCLVVTGVISIARGVSFLSLNSDAAHACPACRLGP
jgi:sulfite exporter TauE/SafE